MSKAKAPGAKKYCICIFQKDDLFPALFPKDLR
jgi:hypothetical protein